MLLNQLPKCIIIAFCTLISIYFTQAQEITENNADQWQTFAEDGQPASVANVNHTDSVKQGNYAIRFDTQSGFATGLSYPNTFPQNQQFSWNGEGKILKFYFYAINTSPFGFQAPLKVRLYTQNRFNYFEYDVINQAPLYRWVEMFVPLENSTQLVNQVGNPNLNNINAIELILDTWDYAFKVYLDGLELVNAEDLCNGKANEYVELKNLLVVLRNHNGNTLNAPLAEIQEVAKAMSEFYWKHSKQSIHLTWDYVEITDNVDAWGNADSGIFSPYKIGQLLSVAPYAVANNTYDAVVAIANNGGNYGWTSGGNQLLGKAGFCHFKWWPDFFDANRWTLVHEFNHTMDGLMSSSGKFDYPHNHPGAARVNGELIPHTGPDSDLNAQILQSLCKTDWLKLTNNGIWGTLKTFIDNDEDGFADFNNNLPMDENRFSSNTNAVDTDNDLLSDLEEYYVGVHNSSNPNNKDTDGDGIADGTDHQPLYATLPIVPFLQTAMGSNNLSQYNFIGKHNGTDIYANYDNTYLHLALANNNYISAGNFQLHVDLNNDGLFYGKDNLFFQFNNQQLSNLILRDAASVGPGDFSDYLESTLPASTVVTTISNNNLFVSIPASNTLYDFGIIEGNSIGLRIDNNSGYNTLFENDDYVSFTLGESCVEELFLTSYPFNNYTYATETYINATGEVLQDNINLKAEMHITLLQGFSVNSNTNFSASIKNCVQIEHLKLTNEDNNKTLKLNQAVNKKVVLALYNPKKFSCATYCSH